MLFGAVQMNSQLDVEANLARVVALVKDACARGAEIVALPENFAFFGPEDEKREVAEVLGQGRISTTLQALARETGIPIVGGGMPERSHDPMRPYNTSILVDAGGRIAGAYRKIHLFDVDLADGTRVEESAGTSPGAEASVTPILGTKLGMTVCYDLRFPELYRRLSDHGARVVTVPAAFTLTTGKDHWHVLLRARAIENEVYVVAPAQWGAHPRGRRTYGKSLVVDPWGEVIAQAQEGEGVLVAKLDFAYQDRVRRELPCLSHRVL